MSVACVYLPTYIPPEVKPKRGTSTLVGSSHLLLVGDRSGFRFSSNTLRGGVRLVSAHMALHLRHRVHFTMARCFSLCNTMFHTGADYRCKHSERVKNYTKARDGARAFVFSVTATVPETVKQVCLAKRLHLSSRILHRGV